MIIIIAMLVSATVAIVFISILIFIIDRQIKADKKE